MVAAVPQAQFLQGDEQGGRGAVKQGWEQARRELRLLDPTREQSSCANT